MCSSSRSLFVFILCLRASVNIVNTEAVHYLNCTAPLAADCPVNSLCTQEHDSLVCVCRESFVWNSAWQLDSNATVEYCRSTNETQTQTKDDTNKLRVYLRSPARKESVAFAILMVLLAATLATALLYLLQVLKPLKRTKHVYMQLKRRRQNRHPLQEFDEIDLTWTDTNQNSVP